MSGDIIFNLLLLLIIVVVQNCRPRFCFLSHQSSSVISRAAAGRERVFYIQRQCQSYSFSTTTYVIVCNVSVRSVCRERGGRGLHTAQTEDTHTHNMCRPPFFFYIHVYFGCFVFFIHFSIFFLLLLLAQIVSSGYRPSSYINNGVPYCILSSSEPKSDSCSLTWSRWDGAICNKQGHIPKSLFANVQCL